MRRRPWSSYGSNVENWHLRFMDIAAAQTAMPHAHRPPAARVISHRPGHVGLSDRVRGLHLQLGGDLDHNHGDSNAFTSGHCNPLSGLNMHLCARGESNARVLPTKKGSRRSSVEATQLVLGRL